MVRLRKSCWRAGAAAVVLALAVVALVPSKTLSAEDLSALNQQVGKLYDQGKFTEAISIAERYVAAAKRARGEEHIQYAAAIAWLGQLYKSVGRYAEAEPLLKRFLALREKVLGRNHNDVATALNHLASLYLDQARYAEAEPLYQRALAIREKALGPDHPGVRIALNSLAVLYHAQGRYAEAERLFKRSLAIREKAQGPDHADLATPLYNLGDLFQDQRRYIEAEALYKRALAIDEIAHGPDHLDVATSLASLASVYSSQGRYTEAEALYKRALAIDEKTYGPNHPSVATSLNNVAELYRDQGRYAEAEPLYRRALAINEKARGPNHPSVATSLNNVAELYRDQGRYAEAEPLYKRALAIEEKARGPDHPEEGTTLNNLALLYQNQGRYAEAELLFKRALAIDEKAHGPDHPAVAPTLSNLGTLYDSRGRYAEAEPLFKRALAIDEKAHGPDHPAVATTLNNLAALYTDDASYPEAESFFKRSLAIRKKALGRDHLDVAMSLNNLAELYRIQGRYAEAEPLHQSSLAIWEKALDPDHPNVAAALSNLAMFWFVQGDWARAVDYWRGSTNVVVRRSQRGTHDVGQALTGKRKSEAERNSFRFWGLVKAGHRLAAAEHGTLTGLSEEMFQMAQWGQSSEAAAALSQMAARQAKGSGPLATLVRERQDLVAQWQKGDDARTAAASRSPDQRNAKAQAVNSRRLAEIEARIAAIDETLKRDFPEYAAIARPQPLSIADVQAQINDDEALVLFLDTPARKPTPEETFIWVVTKTDMRWVRSGLGTAALQDGVNELRCGLDRSNWHDASAWPEATDDQKRRKKEQIARRERCQALTGKDVSGQQPLPFDLKQAHGLYQGLFGEIEDVIKGKHLLIVPSGPLTSLPFQVLVTVRPHTKNVVNYRDAAWLTRKHPITVLPSVASLATLRRVDKGSSAPEPFIGYGDPRLRGHTNCGRNIVPDTCPQDSVDGAALPTVTSGVLVPLANLASLFRNGIADVAAVRRMCPLPDTAHELKCVARSLGAKEDNVVVGPKATETALKSARLDRYRVVHFATHGLLAGETAQLAKARAEPALVLTPPDKPTADDDGLLTASEITALKLNADWVIMSACNTAGGDKPGAEPLSGLASAFFYAGARALLVSHWPVDSYAATILTSRTFAEMQKDKGIGRAEAFQRAMLAFMDDPKRPRAAHPSVWAPFIVVGEGAAVR